MDSFVNLLAGISQAGFLLTGFLIGYKFAERHFSNLSLIFKEEIRTKNERIEILETDLKSLYGDYQKLADKHADTVAELNEIKIIALTNKS